VSREKIMITHPPCQPMDFKAGPRCPSEKLEFAPDFWRNRAEGTRRLVELIENNFIAETMLDIAVQHEELPSMPSEDSVGAIEPCPTGASITLARVASILARWKRRTKERPSPRP